MNNSSSKIAKATIFGTLWAYASTYSSKLMVLVSTTILARLLAQEDFGIVGYALVIMGYLDIINGLGIGPALIYYPRDDERTNMAFWLGLAVGITLFAMAWFLAPLAGEYFNDARAVPVTRVLALSFPLSALSLVHEFLLRKELAFKRKAVADFVRAMGKGIISIVLALLGFGVWSLVIGQLMGVVFSVLAYWKVMPWYPSCHLNFSHTRSLLTYGLNIVSVRALSVVSLNTDFLLVGRYLGAALLGTYSLAFRIPEMIIGQFADIIGQVLFPAYSKMGYDSETYQKGVVMTIRYVSLVTVPVGLGLALVARPFVLTLFTEKWENAIPVLVAISLAMVLDTLTYNFGDVYKALGRPNILTKLAIVRVIILLPALWWAVTGPGTLIAVSKVVVGVSVIEMVTSFLVGRWILHISLPMILRALRPTAIGSSGMTLIVLGVLALCADTTPAIQLVLAVLAGGTAYLSIMWFFENKVIVTAVTTLRKGIAQRS
ncbi:MAG: lipopolysaccharide biosynthesis protein [Candidatus Electrothrix sp. GW3-4]|uniref:lipopolysaccharide biosynthesis protein n=1 Tax=Candidatus Electrothrix sp. GW3-4 TaxID=3126740 RepID=UPI0030D1D193